MSELEFVISPYIKNGKQQWLVWEREKRTPWLSFAYVKYHAVADTVEEARELVEHMNNPTVVVSDRRGDARR